MRLVLATLHTRGLQEGEVWPSGMLSEGRGSYVWGHAVRGGGIAPSLGAVTFREAVWGGCDAGDSQALCYSQYAVEVCAKVHCGLGAPKPLTSGSPPCSPQVTLPALAMAAR